MFSIANPTEILYDIRITVFGAARVLSILENDHYWPIVLVMQRVSFYVLQTSIKRNQQLKAIHMYIIVPCV